MAKRTQTATDPSQVEQQCSHHWMIEEVVGPTSVGVCKLCGERKEFRNELRKRSTPGEAGYATGSDTEAEPEGGKPSKNQDTDFETLIKAATQEDTFDEWLAAINKLGKRGRPGSGGRKRPAEE